METAVSAPDNKRLVAGDPTVFSPPFPLHLTFTGAADRCRSPTRLHGLTHVRSTTCQARPVPASRQSP